MRPFQPYLWSMFLYSFVLSIANPVYAESGAVGSPQQRDQPARPVSLVTCQLAPTGNEVTKPAADVPFGSNPDCGNTIRVNDIELYCEAYGSGRPLLLMHGNGGSISALKALIPFLAKRYQVIAIDGRAHGRSGDSDQELTFKLMASDTAVLIETLHLPPVLVVGWSDGGIVGLELASAYPDKVAALVASGANFVADSSALPADAIDPAKIIWFQQLGPLEKQRYIAASRFPNRAALIYDKVINLDLKYPNFTLTELGKIQTPVLVVAGDHDEIIDTHTLALFHALPHADLFIVPHSHHSVMIDRPQLLSAMISEFFDTPFHDLE
jgi:pimeloyl-ACP methyl ester carboxylesterase